MRKNEWCLFGIRTRKLRSSWRGPPLSLYDERVETAQRVTCLPICAITSIRTELESKAASTTDVGAIGELADLRKELENTLIERARQKAKQEEQAAANTTADREAALQESDEVEFVKGRSWEERDAALRKRAIELD